MKIVFFISCSLFWLLPEKLSLWHGPSRFIDLVDFFFISLVFFLFFVLQLNVKSLKKTKILCAVFITLACSKVILGLIWSPQGLVGSYYANTEWIGSPEPSWVYSDLKGKATRIDSHMNFISKGFSLTGQTFPLHFANDNRFNWYGENAHKRKKFQFSAKWEGFLHILETDPKTGILFASDYGDLSLGGEEQKKSTKNKPVRFQLSPGSHKIQIRYSNREQEPRKLFLGWVTDKGEIKPIPSSRLSPEKRNPLQKNKFLTIFNMLLHLLWFGVLGYAVKKSISVLLRNSISKEHVLLFIFAMIMAGLFLFRLISKGTAADALILSGGNDWLTYESMARNILMGDILDIRSTGEAPYYYFPLYRYLLAGLHLLFGESIISVTYAQSIIMICNLFMLYRLGRTLYNRRVAILAATLPICFGFWKYSERLLDTTFNIFFSLSALFFLIRYGRDKKLGDCLLAGFFMGIACIIRGNFIPFVPFAIGWILFKTPNWKKKGIQRAVAFSVIVVLVMLPTGIRNYYVANDFNITGSNGPVNIWWDNHPPGQEMPEYDQLIPTVIEYALTQPYDFLGGLLKKAAYIIGIKWPLKIKINVLLPTLLAMIGALIFLLNKKIKYRQEILLLSIWILVMDAILIITKPWVYGWRLVAPTFPAIYIIFALFVDQKALNKKPA